MKHNTIFNGSNIEAVNISERSLLWLQFTANPQVFIIWQSPFKTAESFRSLGTRCYETAKQVTPQIEKQILSDIISGVSDKKSKELSFNNLVSKYLEYHGHQWVSSTRKRNKELLNKYLRKGFPDNSTTKAMTIRVINDCNNWGFKRGLISKPMKDRRGEQVGK